MHTLKGKSCMLLWLCNLYSIACSPHFADDSQVIAVVTDEIHTYTINNYGSVGDWLDRVELLEDNTTSFAITAASDICFPANFDHEYELFVGVVSAAGGDVYQADTDIAFDLGIDAGIISLDLVGAIGNTQLLAGENGAAKVWSSPDDGDSWESIGRLDPTNVKWTFEVVGAGY